MSSTLSYNNIIWSAEKAVDGNVSRNADVCHCCAATTSESNPWLQVDLGKRYNISEVQILGRNDKHDNKLNGLSIYLKPNGSNMGTALTTIQDAVEEFTYTLKNESASRFVTLVFQGLTKFLVICEIKVFATVCSDQTYGQDCGEDCGHCLNGVACNKVNGSCTSCAAGYKGTLCKTECIDGNYRENCEEKCGHCLNGVACNKVNGSCSSCAAGYTGTLCKTDCIDGNYGNNCSYVCGHCLNGMACNKVNGTCNSCDAGYKGGLCTTECENGSYGLGCTPCGHCYKGNPCGKVNGNCSFCAAGYSGVKCDKECDHNTFGENCIHACHCAGNIECDIYNGSCPDDKCAYGFTGKNCSYDLNLIPVIRDQVDVSMSSQSGDRGPEKAIDSNPSMDADKCDCCSETNTDAMAWWRLDMGQKYPIENIQFYGRNDSTNFYQFIGFELYLTNTSNITGLPTYVDKKNNQTHIFNISVPNTLAKFITIRKSGILNICELKIYEGECRIGAYGKECSNVCHCADSKACNRDNGTCKSRECQPGWKGRACNKACEFGSFGSNCNGTCGMCKYNETCNLKSGVCENGCAVGRTGKMCNTNCPSSKFGEDCTSRCHCVNNVQCDIYTGECPDGICALGYVGFNCSTECDAGTYGSNCSHTCHCLNGSSCDHRNGVCSPQLCEPGWKSQNCSIACDNGTFGINCSETCHCARHDESCITVNGTCLSGCHKNYKGPSCRTKVEKTYQEPPGEAEIGGAVGGLVVLLVIIVVLVVIIKRRTKESKPEQSFIGLGDVVEPRRTDTLHNHASPAVGVSNGASNAPSHDHEYYTFETKGVDVSIKQLWYYIRNKKKNKCEAFYTEFKKLKHGLQYDTEAASNEKNRGKNRYREMYAYDHSRVELEVTGEGETDYINACFIDGYEKTTKFIASQGPTENMTDDFWRMMWQQKPDKIVMLTNLLEMGSVKCVQYWPDNGTIKYGNIEVELLKVESCTDFETRYLRMTMQNEKPRNVTQYHFKSWPDKSVPDSAWCLVNFWRTVMDQEETAKQCPVVVHCSAGIGRTGTFIALDNLYNQAIAEGSIRPFQMVETLRRQRVNMVQTRDQYVYLHEAVAEALHIGTHYVWSSQWSDIYAYMQQAGAPGLKKSKFQYQYDLIVQSCEAISKIPAVDSEYANVQTLQSEIDEYRPKLKNRGSKYVHELGAIYLPNQADANTFLVCKSPTDTSMEEFWSLINEQNIKTVIMVTETSSPSYKASCHLGTKSSMKHGKFNVNLQQEQKLRCCVERTFAFKENGQGEESRETVKQFEFTAWKNGESTPTNPHSMLELLEVVDVWQPHISASQPVLVHCGDGFTRCGMVCVVMNELQRMKRDDGHVNVVESVMMIKQRHRNIIHDFKQYHYCNDVILEHIQESQIYMNV